MDSQAKYQSELRSYLEQYKSQLSRTSQDRLHRGSVLRILDSKNKQDQILIKDAPRILDFLSPSDKKVRMNRLYVYPISNSIMKMLWQV